jgi:superfamily II DNA helicase RecQ
VQLPTGGGKTLLVKISALSDSDKISVVFMPYTTLREDLGRRLRATSVDTRIFTSAYIGYVNIVLVTLERAAE